MRAAAFQPSRPHLTKLKIGLAVQEGQQLQDAVGNLPGYCRESFQEHAKGHWSGEFIVSCPVAPDLAEGDFVDDLAPYFPHLLNLKTFYSATFEFQIAVGAPASESFELASHLVAMLASLGSSIMVVANPFPNKHEPLGDG